MTCLLVAMAMVAAEDEPGPPFLVDNRLLASSDRRDAAVWHSPPDSGLHLNAATNDRYHRFPDRPVRAGSRYRLSFHYLVASGSEGRVVVRVTQYHETGTAWRVVETREWPLTVVGRWQEMVIDLTVLPGSTNLAVAVQVDGKATVFECWLDDLVFRPVGMPVVVGP